MAVNPYTLNNLYQNNILDYVPVELFTQTPVGANYNIQNPYLYEAAQGGLYQQYSDTRDNFYSSQNVNSYNNSEIHKRNNSIKRKFGFDSTTGRKSRARANMYGEEGIGKNSRMEESNSAIDYNSIKNGASNFVSKVANMPVALKGLISLGVIIGTLVCFFRSGKKPSAAATGSFWSKLNPFKKTAAPAPAPIPTPSATTGIWTKILKFLRIK